MAANSTKLVVQKGNAALDGAGHAHLVLLHEQLDQIGLLVRIQHAGKQAGMRLGIPVVQVGIVSPSEWHRQQALLLGAREGGIEVIEVERFQIFAASQDGMLQLAADVAGKQAGAGDAGAQRIAYRARKRAIGLQQPLVEDICAIAGIAAE